MELVSNHMNRTKSYFSEHNEKIKGKIKFGDDSYVKIEDKGSFLFQRKTSSTTSITFPNLRATF